MIRTTLSEALKDALKAQDKRRIATLRLISAALKDRDIDARGHGRDQLSQDEIFALLQKMIKQRQESLKIYEEAGRADLAEQEREEIQIIGSFLPKPLSEEEMRLAVAQAVKELNCQGLRDMGKTMALLKERFGGRMDFGKASGLVKQALA